MSQKNIKKICWIWCRIAIYFAVYYHENYFINVRMFTSLIPLKANNIWFVIKIVNTLVNILDSFSDNLTWPLTIQLWFHGLPRYESYCHLILRYTWNVPALVTNPKYSYVTTGGKLCTNKVIDVKKIHHSIMYYLGMTYYDCRTNQ